LSLRMTTLRTNGGPSSECQYVGLHRTYADAGADVEIADGGHTELVIWPMLIQSAACLCRMSHRISPSAVPIASPNQPGRKRSVRSSALPGAEVSSTLTRPRESRWRTRGGDWQCGGNRTDWGDSKECGHTVGCVLKGQRSAWCRISLPARNMGLGGTSSSWRQQPSPASQRRIHSGSLSCGAVPTLPSIRSETAWF
jgi:hypothetical protein